MQNGENKSCFLCGRNGTGDRLERHHIFGGARRKLSEQYNLCVYLCGERCHRNGKYSAHQNFEIAEYLHKYAEALFLNQGHTKEEFIKVFGKDYLKDE